MDKLELLNIMLLESRKTTDFLTKNLLLTMKGEFQNKSKDSKLTDNELIESISKSMIKNCEQIGTLVADKEINILNIFMPTMLTEDETKSIINELISSNPGKQFGFYMGNLMKNKQIDGKLAKTILTKMLIP